MEMSSLTLKREHHYRDLQSDSRDGILKLLRRLGIDSASLCSMAGRFDKPIPTGFLAPIFCLKIPPLVKVY